jgi:hypothetical protein
MKYASAIALGVFLLAFACAPSEPTSSLEESGWITLFDGSSLDGWTLLGDANWQLAEDAVEADTGSGFLVTEDSYGDFELELEFWVDETANSGVFIRCTDPGEIGADNSYEVNIFDNRPDQTYRTGGIVFFAAPSSNINTGGQWNSYAIRADGSQLTVTLNGIETVNTADDTYAEGPIALQYGAGTVRFRNVRIRPL